MKIIIASVGKPSLDFAKSGCDLYLRRLQHYGKAEWLNVRASTPKQESGALLQITDGACRVALDENGSTWTSRQLADKLSSWEMNAIPTLAFLIGGANGHESSLIKQCDLCWSLSPLTLQHEMALLLVLEQLYRARTIQRGEPYHRD